VFGLVRRSRLLAAEKRLVEMRLTVIREERAGQDLMRELEIERQMRRAAESERDRLQAILTAHPIEPAAPIEEKPAVPEEAPPIRVLSGFEVVARATMHRNTRNNAGR